MPNVLFTPSGNDVIGDTIFVLPDLVEGTLREGINILRVLSDPFSRALFMHFLLSDVHPFNDGNGRLSRIMMTKELVSARLSRIVIPTVFRNDYLGRSACNVPERRAVHLCALHGILSASLRRMLRRFSTEGCRNMGTVVRLLRGRTSCAANNAKPRSCD